MIIVLLFLTTAVFVGFEESSYTFNEDSISGEIIVVRIGASDFPFTVRVIGG